MSETQKRISKYIRDWKNKGYAEDIPDEVPHRLMKLGLAPSYKAICLTLLSNDMQLTQLGFSTKKSKWYGAFKRVEIENRGKGIKGPENLDSVIDAYEDEK